MPTSHHRSRVVKHTAPSLECLEGRCLPSVTVIYVIMVPLYSPAPFHGSHLYHEPQWEGGEHYHNQPHYHDPDNQQSSTSPPNDGAVTEPPPTNAYPSDTSQGQPPAPAPTTSGTPPPQLPTTTNTSAGEPRYNSQQARTPRPAAAREESPPRPASLVLQNAPDRPAPPTAEDHQAEDIHTVAFRDMGGWLAPARFTASLIQAITFSEANPQATFDDVAASVRPDASTPRSGGANPVEEGHPPEAAALPPISLTAQAADLITGGFSVGVAALEQIAKTLLEPNSETEVYRLPRWVGVTAWMLAAASAVAAVHPRRKSANGLNEEELP